MIYMYQMNQISNNLFLEPGTNRMSGVRKDLASSSTFPVESWT